jgi:hypothetical protein
MSGIGESESLVALSRLVLSGWMMPSAQNAGAACFNLRGRFTARLLDAIGGSAVISNWMIFFFRTLSPVDDGAEFLPTTTIKKRI